MTFEFPEVVSLDILPVDIERGIKMKCDACPIAHALVRQLDADHAWAECHTYLSVDKVVDGDLLTAQYAGDHEAVDGFMNAFDSGDEPVQPVTIVLRRVAVTDAL